MCQGGSRIRRKRAEDYPRLAQVVAICMSACMCLGSTYLRDFCCTTLSAPGRRSLRCTERSVQIVPFVRKRTKQNRAFSVVGPSLWNVHPLVLHLFPRVHLAAFYAT